MIQIHQLAGFQRGYPEVALSSIGIAHSFGFPISKKLTPSYCFEQCILGITVNAKEDNTRHEKK